MQAVGRTRAALGRPPSELAQPVSIPDRRPKVVLDQVPPLGRQELRDRDHTARAPAQRSIASKKLRGDGCERRRVPKNVSGFECFDLGAEPFCGLWIDVPDPGASLRAALVPFPQAPGKALSEHVRMRAGTVGVVVISCRSDQANVPLSYGQAAPTIVEDVACEDDRQGRAGEKDAKRITPRARRRSSEPSVSGESVRDAIIEAFRTAVRLRDDRER